MNEVFKGRRRKIGVVTLVTACAMTGLWIRSAVTCDVICIPIGNQTRHWIYSQPNWIGWIRFDDASGFRHQRSGRLSPFFRNGYQTLQVDVNRHAIEGPYSFVYSRWDSTRNQFRVSSNANPHLIVPYWFIVGPLTLISLRLLLTKSLHSTKTTSVKEERGKAVAQSDEI